MNTGLQRFGHGVRRTGEWAAAGLLAGILVAILVGIVRRYVAGSPLVWIDELAVVLFLWCVFVAGAFAVRLPDHVSFDLLHGALSPSGRRWTGVIANACAGGVLLAATPKVADFVLFLWREKTPALQWRLDMVYACFILFFAAAALMLLARAVMLIAPGWRDRV